MVKAKKRFRLCGLLLVGIVSLVAACDESSNGARRSGSSPSVQLTGCPATDGAALKSVQHRSVRILDFDGTKLFVPAHWLRGYVDDGRSKSDGVFRAIVSDAIDPPINSNDCPGVVHRFKVGERASRFGAVAFSIKGRLPLSPADKKAQDGNVIQVFVGARTREATAAPLWPDEDVSVGPEGSWVKLRRYPIYKYKGTTAKHAGACTARFDNVDKVWLIFDWVKPTIGIGFVVQSDTKEPLSDWRELCGMADGFYEWVTSDPKHRHASFNFYF